MRFRSMDYLYIALPIALWPLSFIVLHHIFIYAMLSSASILAAISLYSYKNSINVGAAKKKKEIIIFGLAAASALYIIFYAGGILLSSLGLGTSVNLIYRTIYTQSQRGVLAIMLALIAVFEEVYWRGGLQGYIKKTRLFKNYVWVVSALYYASVHLLTTNLVLALSALVVGLITSFIANRYGIISSAIAHIIWIEAIVIFLPISV